MSTVIAIHWNEPTFQLIVAQHGRITATTTVPVEANLEPAVLSQRLAATLAPYSPGRAQTIVALSRSSLEWQHLSLPPCPADELADVVQLQAEREPGAADDDLGFDFLPLVGDEQTPYQVLTVALSAGELGKIRQICQGANLKLQRIVPLSTGWPAITNQLPPSQQSTQLYVTPQANEALLWATHAQRVTLFRQFQLADHNDQAALAPAVASQLRRTLLALSQHAGSNQPLVSLVGHQQSELAQLTSTLNEQLEVTVQLVDVTTQHPALNAEANPVVLPLAGLALDQAQGNRPLVDLLHPRRRPPQQVNVRTYALAATAAALSLILLGWFGYSQLQAPLDLAARDQAELTLLQEPLEKLKEYEQRAAAIRDWQSEAPNLLIQLQQVSQTLRPTALKADNFAADQDVILEKLALDKRELTIDALTRASETVQPVGVRFRQAKYGYRRHKSEPSKTNKKYPWYFKSTVEVTSASQGREQPEGSPPAQEPSS